MTNNNTMRLDDDEHNFFFKKNKHIYQKQIIFSMSSLLTDDIAEEENLLRDRLATDIVSVQSSAVLEQKVAEELNRELQGFCLVFLLLFDLI